MQVKFVGFAFDGVDGLRHFDEFVAQLSIAPSEPVADGEVSRMVFMNGSHSADYYIGLVVTVRDQKAFCQLRNDGGQLVVRVSELDENSQHMDFSFFVIHKQSMMGMYQTYHGSCSPSSFFSIMRSRYTAFLKDRRETEVASLPHETKKRAVAEVRRHYGGRLECRLVVRTESLREMIEQLSRVKEFTYSVAVLEANEPEFQPLSGVVRKVKRTILFRPDVGGSSVAHALSRLVGRLEDQSGSIVGEDVNGLAKTLHFLDNPDVFQVYDYDDVAPRINSLQIQSFQTSWVVDRLLATCGEHPYLFAARTT